MLKVMTIVVRPEITRCRASFLFWTVLRPQACAYWKNYDYTEPGFFRRTWNS